MYSMEVCVSTVSIIVGDDALGVPFGELTPWFWYLRCWIIRGDIVVIISVNSMGEEYRDAHFCETEITSLPYRCGGQVFSVAKPCCNCGLVPSTGERCSPLQICCRGVRVSAVYIRFSSFKQGAGSAFLCDQNLSSCSPNSRWQNVSSYTVAPQGFRFVVKPLLLIHEKWVFCCRKNATIAEMLPN